ncbi:hypothetical protein [Streptomyces sp. enrichment culture]|uniref:hypothetical protein n=1 Tax=Streptomyces sp. enrichment culture TaxID=1795815 RepID=UPI003F563F5D
MHATDFVSHDAMDVGSGAFHREMLIDATGEPVTTSRMEMPAQDHWWKASHQCSGPVTVTGPDTSNEVPIPFVPVHSSDHDDHGARLCNSARRCVVGCRRRRCGIQLAVHFVLVTASVPRSEDLRPDARFNVFTRGEAFPCTSYFSRR